MTALVAALAGVWLMSGCGSPPQVSESSSLREGAHLATEVMPPPHGYAPEGLAGASGRMTPDAFGHLAGDGSASSAHFVAGYRQNYVNPATQEGIIVSLLEFSSPGDAQRYLEATAPGTLSDFGATRRPYPSIPGALALDATRLYSGEWAHAVVATKGNHYMSLVYVLAGQGSAPFEFRYWVADQYRRVA